MGNCISTKKAVAQEEKDQSAKDAKMVEHKRSAPSSNAESTRPIDGRERRSVTFKSREEVAKDRERYGKTNDGLVRIRVVLTQSELKQLLNNGSEYSSVEQLLSAIELRTQKMSQARKNRGGMNGSWRPALDSIPEDY